MSAPVSLRAARDGLRDRFALVGLAGLFALSVLLTSTLVIKWTPSSLVALAALLAVGVLYFVRPGVFIVLVLLPFAFLDEKTPDVVPALSGISSQLYSERFQGLVAPRDIALVLAALAAASWFPTRPGRGRRALGRVTWVVVLAALCLCGAMIVGLYGLHDMGGSVKALRPFYTCVLTAYIVWRVLRSMTWQAGQRLIVTGSLVVGISIIALGILRVAGLAGTAVDISGVPITFYDAASPYALMGCVGIWSSLVVGRLVEGRQRVMLFILILAGLLVGIASQRRAVLVGYAAAAFALLVLNAVRRHGGLVRSLRILAAVLTVLVVAIVTVSIVVPGARELLIERATTAAAAASSESSTDTSLQFRVEESDAVTALARQNLWVGIGPSSGFTPVNGLFLPTDGTYTHNSYLALPLRYGLWGILALVVLVAGFIIRVTRGLFRDPPIIAWPLGAVPLALLPAMATASFLTNTARWGIIMGAAIGAFDFLTEPADADADEPIHGGA